MQETDVVGELRGALGDSAEHSEDLAVQLAGIRLAGDGKAGGISHFLRDFPVEFLYFFVIAVKQLQKACLRAGRSLGSEQLRLAELVLHVLQIHQKILDPERRALSHGSRLGGLEMRKREGGEIFIFHRKRGENADHGDQLAPDKTQGVRHDDDIGVVAHIAGGGAQVDNRAGVRALLAKGVHVRHHVVPDDLFTRLCDVVIDVVGVLLHFVDLLLGNGQTQFHFGLRQRDPETAPCTEFFIRRKQEFHFRVRIPRGQRGFIGVSQSIPLLCQTVFRLLFSGIGKSSGGKTGPYDVSDAS